MAYREVSRMDVTEVVRRWQAGESQRRVARQVGLSRTTVQKYLHVAEQLGLSSSGPPPNVEQVAQLVRLSELPTVRPAPQVRSLDGQREQIARWLQRDHLQQRRVQELLAQRGVCVTYSTLRRFVRQAGLLPGARTTVRMADTAPGEVAEMDFGRLGLLVDQDSGKRVTIWALVVVLTYSRHSFVWPLLHQTLPAVIEGLEIAWHFFGGIPLRLVVDNFPAAVAGMDPLAPRPTRGFLEYSQERGFLIDPARVRSPKDKPHVERHIQYVRERFWKGGLFVNLEHVRFQAERWCRNVAGQRVHGTTRKLPLVVFEDEERRHLQPAPKKRYDVPAWGIVKVHPDHHVGFQSALYSAPSTTCPPGTMLEVRSDSQLLRLYKRGELVKIHPRKPKGGRSTDPDDYPTEKTAYALRAPDRVIQQAAALGDNVAAFAQRLLSGPLPWAKLRQGQRLLRLAERYSATRLDAVCARALGFDLIDVRRLERMLVLAIDAEHLPVPSIEERLVSLPAGRFARPGAAFDHRHLQASLWSEDQP